MTWLLFSLLSAVLASLTAVFAKAGLAGINSHLAAAVRTAVILVFVWAAVFMTEAQKDLPRLTGRQLFFLILSGLTAALSWLCYFRALQLGEVSKVAPIDKLSVVLTVILAACFLNEPLTVKSIAGSLVITAGVLILL
ncbi:MAG: EamA family transporter [Deltaproteobacteria bacterium]|nr:EamA family transporter [Deltaproteobacteria bacterium]